MNLADRLRKRAQGKFRRQTWDVYRASYNATSNTFGRKVKVLSGVAVSVYPTQRLDNLTAAEIADLGTAASVGSGFCAVDIDLQENDTLIPAGATYKLPSEVKASDNQYTINGFGDWAGVGTRVLALTKEGA